MLIGIFGAECGVFPELPSAAPDEAVKTYAG